MTATLISIAEYGTFAFAAFVFVVQFLAREAGVWFGQRRAAKQQEPVEGVGVVVGGMLGLLGFVLALTLSFANARFQERRDGTLAEANAIGTAWLRAEAIGHPRGTEIARLLEDYTRLRMEFVQAEMSSPNLEDLHRRTNAAQSLMWGNLAAILRERTDPVAVALQASLNDTFDLATTERFAFATRMPPQLVYLLMSMALVAMAGVGYQLGLRGKALRFLSTLLVAMWTAVLVVILDMGSPRLGSIRTSAAVYEWTLQGFQGGLTIPPAPAAR